MLVANPKGNYSFVRGIAPYSGGAVAAEGYEIIHVRMSQPVPLAAGFERVKAQLEAMGRPLTALCSMELRSPRPFTFPGFNEFNAGYVKVLREWGLLFDGMNPVARTNIAPEIGAPTEPSLYGFGFTVASKTTRKTFIVAGAGELPEGSLDPHDVIRRGELSAEALRVKAQYVMGLMTGRLTGLGVSWDLVTVAEMYTVHPVWHLLAEDVVKKMGKGAAHGVTWHYSRPPIETIEFEMDVRGCARELVL